MVKKHVTPDQKNVGKFAYVTGPDASGHGFQPGENITIESVSHPYYIAVSTTNTSSRFAIYPESLKMWATRSEHAATLKEEIETTEKELSGMRQQYARLTEYESDEAELAALMVNAMDDSVPKSKRISTLTTLLKGRLKMDLL